MTRGGSLEFLATTPSETQQFLEAYQSHLQGVIQTKYDFEFSPNGKLMIDFRNVLGVKTQ